MSDTLFTHLNFELIGWPPPDQCQIVVLRADEFSKNEALSFLAKCVSIENNAVSVFCLGAAFHCDFMLIGDLAPNQHKKLIPIGDESRAPRRHFNYLTFNGTRLYFKGQDVKKVLRLGASQDRAPAFRVRAVDVTKENWTDGSIRIDKKRLGNAYFGVLYACGKESKKQPKVWGDSLCQTCIQIATKHNWVLDDAYSLKPGSNTSEDSHGRSLGLSMEGPGYLIVFSRPKPEEYVNLFDEVHRICDDVRHEFQVLDEGLTVHGLPMSPQLLSPEVFQTKVRIGQINDGFAKPTVGDKTTQATAKQFYALFEPDGDEAGEPDIHLPNDHAVFVVAKSRSGKTPLVARVALSFLLQEKPSVVASTVSQKRLLFVNAKTIDTYYGDPKDSYKANNCVEGSDFKFLRTSLGIVGEQLKYLRPDEILAAANESDDETLGDAIYTEFHVRTDDWNRESESLVNVVDKLVNMSSGKGVVVVVDEILKYLGKTSGAVDNQNLRNCGIGLVNFLQAYNKQLKGRGVCLICITQDISDLLPSNASGLSKLAEKLLPGASKDIDQLISDSSKVIGAPNDKQQSAYEEIVNSFNAAGDEMKRLEVDSLDKMYQLIKSYAAKDTGTLIGPVIIVPPSGNHQPIPCHIPRTFPQ